MKVGNLALGASYLVCGFICFWTNFLAIQRYGTSLGQLELIMSEGARKAYGDAQLWATIGATIGGVLMLIGLVICIYGAVVKPKETRI
jgi:hypothetical protein